MSFSPESNFERVDYEVSSCNVNNLEKKVLRFKEKKKVLSYKQRVALERRENLAAYSLFGFPVTYAGGFFLAKSLGWEEPDFWGVMAVCIHMSIILCTFAYSIYKRDKYT